MTALAAIAGAQATPPDLVERLQSGGHVLVMRHARSPRETPARAQAQPDNGNLERQLDEEGRAGATAMGNALRRLEVPIGDVLTSPAYRAVETVRLAGLLPFTIVPELGDGGQSMTPVTAGQADWLRARSARPPGSRNTLIVTHQPNLAAAFPEWGAGVGDGEVVILRPDGRGGSVTIARVPIDQWPRLRVR